MLIDEIDQHLHPQWQGGIVQATRRAFPNLQFVVTTHSPLVLAGLRPAEIIRLGYGDSGSVVRLIHHPETGELVKAEQGLEDATPDPRMLSASELVRHWYGVDGSMPTQTTRLLRRYYALANDPWRDDAEETQLQGLIAGLRDAGIIPLHPPPPRQP